jgi:hypothetical protein
MSRVDAGRNDTVSMRVGDDDGDDTYNGRGVVRIISRATRNPSQQKKTQKRRRGKPRTAQILLKASDASLDAPQISPCPTDQLIIVM